MAPLDLFDLAVANDSVLERQFEERCNELTQDHQEIARAFCGTVRTSAVSVNMKPWRLKDFLERERYLTMYELAAVRSERAGTTQEDEIRKWQGEYYAPRVLFDRSFTDGELFIYGALNLGCDGVDYGAFCVVLRPFKDPGKVALLPGNSLQLYIKKSPELQLDETSLRRDVASANQPHSIAGLKHFKDIATRDRGDWARILCHDDNFIEAIFAEPLTLERISVLRIKENEQLRMAELAIQVAFDPNTDESELHDYNFCLASNRLPVLDVGPTEPDK